MHKKLLPKNLFDYCIPTHGYNSEFYLSDVALAVVKMTPATKLLTQKDRQTFLYEFEGKVFKPFNTQNLLECLNQRFPTRSGMEEYQVETTREYFKNKHKNTTAIH